MTRKYFIDLGIEANMQNQQEILKMVEAAFARFPAYKADFVDGGLWFDEDNQMLGWEFIWSVECPQRRHCNYICEPFIEQCGWLDFFTEGEWKKSERKKALDKQNRVREDQVVLGEFDTVEEALAAREKATRQVANGTFIPPATIH